MANGLTTNTIQTNSSGARVAGATPGTAIYGFSAAVMFDRGASESPQPKFVKAQFGDGYEMRMKAGINNNPRTWQLVFNNRTNDDIDNLNRFFTVLSSVDTCRLTIPDITASGDEEAVTVVIEEWNRTFGNAEYYSMSCKAREVFES